MALPTDPLLRQQWHLGNDRAGRYDLNVRGVWSPDEGTAYDGAGVRVAVIDDGFDHRHADLAPNYLLQLDYDFDFRIADAFGDRYWDAHGTAVAGIVAAAADGAGAVGVAFGADLLGYRTYSVISDAWLVDIRDAIARATIAGRADVANISQGIANDLFSEFGAGYSASRIDEVEGSIAAAVRDGRGGLGMTVVKAAGNSRAADYDVNADDWTNDTRQVVVAAVDQDGSVSDYSSYGAALLVSAFGAAAEVVTTDRRGQDGYDPGDFTSRFDGTSAAAPMVSGVVALMYDAEPGLGWRDVQTILAASARHVGSPVGAGPANDERFAWEWNGAQTWNGGGRHFSNDYGYGLVDALAAVRLAESWLLAGGAAATEANAAVQAMDLLNRAVVLPDGNLAGRTFAGQATNDLVVERVTVEVAFSTTVIADLELQLTSPGGAVSRLIADTGGGADFNGTWTFESQAFRGERAAGSWSLRVVDDAAGASLTLSDIVIRAFGEAGVDDRYVFTNAYSDYAGLAGHRTAIRDANGGLDTVNAAAVSSASTIRLDGVRGAIDGVGATFLGIEHAIGGDGADQIFGNAGANQLFGMRGADRMVGGGGADRLGGGDGADVLRGGAGADTLIGGRGDDIFDYDIIAESAPNTRDVIRAGDGAVAFEGVGLASGDRFDFSTLDARAGGANDAFTFGGTGIGTVSCVNAGSNTLVRCNTDADAAFELVLAIEDGAIQASAYRAADFIL